MEMTQQWLLFNSCRPTFFFNVINGGELSIWDRNEFH
jgi:hypothetical protein